MLRTWKCVNFWHVNLSDATVYGKRCFKPIYSMNYSIILPLHSDWTTCPFWIMSDEVFILLSRQASSSHWSGLSNSNLVKSLFLPTSICSLLTWRLLTQTPSVPPASNLKLSFSMSTSSISMQNSKSSKRVGIFAFSTSLWSSVMGSPYQVVASQFDELDVRRIQISSRP